MDNLTQGAIGGLLYTLITGKHHPKQFRLGAGLANIPDLDVFVTRLIPFASPIDANFFHRSISHSILFVTVLSLGVGIILFRYDKTIPYRRYVVATFVSIVFGHLLIDGMTSYGMRYRLPFSTKTTSTDNMFIIDLGMWLITIGGSMWYLLSGAKARIARRVLGVVGGYIALSFFFQRYATAIFADRYPAPIREVEARRTIAEPLQIFLRRQVVKTSSGYYEGYWSMFDKTDDIQRNFYPTSSTGQNIVDQILVSDDKDTSRQLSKILSFGRDFNRIVPQGSGYRIESMNSGPLLGREEGQQDRMFGYMLVPTGTGWSIISDRPPRSFPDGVWGRLWKRVFGI